MALQVDATISDIVLWATRNNSMSDLYESPVDKYLSVINSLVSADIAFLILVSCLVIDDLILSNKKSNCSADMRKNCLNALESSFRSSSINFWAVSSTSRRLIQSLTHFRFFCAFNIFFFLNTQQLLLQLLVSLKLSSYFINKNWKMNDTSFCIGWGRSLEWWGVWLCIEVRKSIHKQKRKHSSVPFESLPCIFLKIIICFVVLNQKQRCHPIKIGLKWNHHSILCLHQWKPIYFNLLGWKWQWDHTTPYNKKNAELAEKIFLVSLIIYLCKQTFWRRLLSYHIIVYKIKLNKF